MALQPGGCQSVHRAARCPSGRQRGGCAAPVGAPHWREMSWELGARGSTTRTSRYWRAERRRSSRPPLVSVTTVVKVKECVRRWRARVRSSLPTPERKTVTRMARTREDDATVTLCEETVARAMKDPAAVRCPHLLAADDDTGGFWRSDDDGARFVKPRSVRTVRVNAPGTPFLAKHVQCDRCHAAMQALAVRSVAVCPACDASVPRHVMARYAHDWDGDPSSLAQLCLFCDKLNQRMAREAEERFRHGDRAAPRPGRHRTVVRVPRRGRRPVHRDDPVQERRESVGSDHKENVSSKRRRRVGGTRAKSSKPDEGVATPLINDVVAHEWEFTRQGYAHGLRGACRRRTRLSPSAIRLRRRRSFRRAKRADAQPDEKTYAGRGRGSAAPNRGAIDVGAWARRRVVR